MKGQKFDNGKVRMGLLPTRGLIAISEVLAFGADKYAKDNWKQVDQPIDRYADALLRHVFAWTGGERNDPESGLHHLAHAGCCVLFLLHFETEPKMTFGAPAPSSGEPEKLRRV